MNTSFSEEQELLRDTMADVAKDVGVAQPQDLPFEPERIERGWRTLAQLGLLALCLPEAAGGHPASGVEIAIIAESLGRNLSPLPYIGVAVLAGGLLGHAKRARGQVIKDLSSGAQRVTVIFDQDLNAPLRLGGPSGEPPAGLAFDAAGSKIGLALQQQASGDWAIRPLSLETTPVNGFDVTRHVTSLRAGPPTEAAWGEVADESLTRWQALSLVSLSADLVGVMGGSLDAAVHYAKNRRQFGRPIGSFQAIQHLCADQLASLEAARGLTYYAAWAVDSLDPATALLAARTAKAYSSNVAREVTEAALQIHGGIGMTWECTSHLFLRRALLDRQLMGNETVHFRSIASQRLCPRHGL